jgi:hypothetical protein
MGIFNTTRAPAAPPYIPRDKRERGSWPQKTGGLDMANERMYILHRPSGYGAFLAKRMGWGWYNYTENTAEQVQRLFTAIEEQYAQGDQDDLELVFEGDPRLKTLIDMDKQYKPSFLLRLKSAYRMLAYYA